MKRIILAVAGLLVFTMINAQTLDEIIKKYTVANKLDKLSSLTSIKLTSKMSMMGMEMPMELWMKNPNKIRSVTTVNGQEVVAAFDGVKGFSLNPMTGATAPVEMTPEQVTQTMKSNLFQNYMANYLKEGKLTLQGEENVSDKPAFKIKADIGGGNSSIIFIDKSSYLIVKTTATVIQQGQTISVETYPSDYKETNGVFIPMKTTVSASGMEIITTYEKVEVNIPMDDSLFKAK